MIGLFIFCFGYYFTAGVVIVLGYHRCLTHGAFKMKKWLEHIIVFFGLPAGTPIQWVANHRYHHIHADDKNDPHSPLIHGFWYAHNGWYLNSTNWLISLLYALSGPIRLLIDAYIRPISNQEYNYLAKDIKADSFYLWLSKPVIYRICLLVHLFLPYTFVSYYWGVSGISTLWLTQIIAYNLGDSINSLGHEKRPQKHSAYNKAKNRRFLALFTFGEALHANHHENPTAANFSLNKYGFDIAWIIIIILKKLNLVSDIKTVEETSIAKHKE